ncbi:anhydro-N-acetylmuramic acid kinase [Sporosarcina sp. NCCP-2716]|uniref:anhydro-N-acetylmuramic acid kinase n=1 Tax=Sporosarcina sp. NCCP-2716 TaxID=2943679 RepID=UPI00204005D2|nr:anhydro-N-acetylmuramic acid kinase [Sporosarcina sp. NCCP-2716]GKV70581.1 anhydro-N-acetylmuramic acid kinase [Sporosarcina sp. NCCP-2716]
MSIRAIGLMSGTSVDGIDAVLVEISEPQGELKVETLGSIETKYTPEERKELLRISTEETSDLQSISSMNFHLGKKFGTAVNNLLKKSDYTSDDIHFISSHGHTIFHQPYKGDGPLDEANTLQIGDISVIADLTKIAVVGDFRTADMAAGGHGAPLTSYIDYLLFTGGSKSMAIQNIGGIGNVTYIPKNASREQILSFDTGPGNMVIDEVVYRVTDQAETYDKDGQYAKQGVINEDLLAFLNEHEYLQVEPPKTTGREVFGAHFVDRIFEGFGHLAANDLVATVSEWTAVTITDSYKNFLMEKGDGLDEVVVGGGGSYNPYLLERISHHLPGVKVSIHEDHGISSDLKEAIGFALLGYKCLKGEYNQLPSATGADHSVIMGKISYTQPEALERMIAVREE